MATYTATGPNAGSAGWSLSGDDAGDFAISRSGVLTFAAAPDFESPTDTGEDNVYQVTVEAYDGTYMDTQEVTVEVTDVDEAPDVDGEASIEYEENGTGAVATYTAVDPEDAEIVWSLGGDDAALFSIEGAELAFAAAPDFESPADADTDNVYQVTVEAYDGTYMGTQDVTVTVTNEDEMGEVTLSPTEPEVGTELTASLADPDGGVSGETWQWAREDNGGGGYSNIPNANSASYTPVEADLGQHLRVTVKYTDAIGSQELEKQSDSPVSGLAINGLSRSSYAENGTMPVATYTASGSDAAMATWSLSGDDAGDFTIEGGVLAFAAAPDFESPADADTDNVYQVTVEAGDGTNMDTQDVTVTVTNVDEAPDVAGEASIEYKENATSTVATYTAADPEMTAIVWSLGGDDAALFSIEDGMLTFVSAPDYETPADMDGDNVYQVTVESR